MTSRDREVEELSKLILKILKDKISDQCTEIQITPKLMHCLHKHLARLYQVEDFKPSSKNIEIDNYLVTREAITILLKEIEKKKKSDLKNNTNKEESKMKHITEDVSPYSRRSKKSPEERKQQKMEQNKTAALRYRQKKHHEVQKYAEEKEVLIEKREKLQKEAESLSTELHYMKKLMKEVCRSQGLI